MRTQKDLTGQPWGAGEVFVDCGKPLAALVSVAEYQQMIQLLGEAGVRTTLHGIPVRIRFDGNRYFIDDESVELYGTGATLAEAQADYWLAVQETYEDLRANEGKLAPYLQEQMVFLRKIVANAAEDSL